MLWSEFSFILKPSPLGGVGVFATHDIPAGTFLFNPNFEMRTMKVKEIPEAFRQYCIYINDEDCFCPERFDRIEVGWYINHSFTPNIAEISKASKGVEESRIIKETIFALHDIKMGDEILIDYNTLNEPEHLKEDYYKRK